MIWVDLTFRDVRFNIWRRQFSIFVHMMHSFVCQYGWTDIVHGCPPRSRTCCSSGNPSVIMFDENVGSRRCFMRYIFFFGFPTSYSLVGRMLVFRCLCPDFIHVHVMILVSLDVNLSSLRTGIERSVSGCWFEWSVSLVFVGAGLRVRQWSHYWPCDWSLLLEDGLDQAIRMTISWLFKAHNIFVFNFCRIFLKLWAFW